MYIVLRLNHHDAELHEASCCQLSHILDQNDELELIQPGVPLYVGSTSYEQVQQHSTSCEPNV